MSAKVRNIGFLRHYFLPPSETFIHNTLRSLVGYRARVFAVARRSAEKFPWDDVTVLRGSALGWLESLVYLNTTWSPRLFAWARGIELLHAHMGYTGVHGLWAAGRLGLPLVTSFYGWDVTIRRTAARFYPTHWLYTLLAGTLFRRGDRFLALSRHMRAALVAQGCPVEKIRVVPIGVDFERFSTTRAPAARTTVLMVGREVDKKGFDDGLRACAAARELGADLRVVLLGTGGPLLPQLQRLAAELRLPVEWPAPSMPVPRAMAEADLLLVPSRRAQNGDEEGTPVVICEGSAARLPVVSTRHAGIPEQVDDGVTGLLAPERDPVALAAHIAALHRDPDRRRAMGEAGHAKMQREYSLAAHRHNVEAVYGELL